MQWPYSIAGKKCKKKKKKKTDINNKLNSGARDTCSNL